MLAACIAVEHGAKGEVQSDKVLMAANNAVKVKSELCQVQVLLREGELEEEEGGGGERGVGG